MICKYCNKESEIAERSKVFVDMVKLSCGHAMTLPKVDDFVSSDGRKPYPFQYKGIEFCRESEYRCLIADEMGLGKTIQALGALRNPDLLPALILVKSSLKIQWFSEVIRWLGIQYIPQIIENGKSLPVEGFKVCIASYDILRRFTTKEKRQETTKYGMEVTRTIKLNPFYDFPFKTIVLDECQSIKNLDSARTDEVMRICKDKKHIIALSGTPIKNNAVEYYPILKILRPEKFISQDWFIRNWVASTWESGYVKYGGIRNPERFKEYTKDFIIRRERKEVMPELPEINRVFHHVDFESDKLKKQYEQAENQFLKEMEQKLSSNMPLDPLGAMAVMRHIVGINKITPTVDKVVEFLLDTDRKIVLFVHHQDVMESLKLLLTNWCLDGGYGLPLVLHSGLNSQERFDMVRNFKDKPEHRIMIASTLAASEGLNLQFCADCVLVERQWNPANEEQAEGRFIRIGQERNQVNAIYMVASGTIDEYFTELVEKKRAAFIATMSGKEVAWQEMSLMKELMEIIYAKRAKKIAQRDKK